MTIGFLHPGTMGATIASACGATKVWASIGRSAASSKRAKNAGLADVRTVAAMAKECEMIVSICPPGAAAELASEVEAAGFAGLYVDTNAIAPSTARNIASRFDRFVDGSIVGVPPADPGNIRLYLAGDEAATIAELWEASAIEVRLVNGAPGAASAIKMAYAGWTKGSAALLLTIRAFAVAEGVEDDLISEWETSLPNLVARSEGSAKRSSAKAWRFVDEMGEIASALRGESVIQLAQ